MGDQDRSLPASVVLDPQLMNLVQDCTPDQAQALQRALRAAYDAGSADAERRTGRFVASVLQPLLGIKLPSERQSDEVGVKRQRALQAAVQLLQGLARRQS